MARTQLPISKVQSEYEDMTPLRLNTQVHEGEITVYANTCTHCSRMIFSNVYEGFLSKSQHTVSSALIKVLWKLAKRYWPIICMFHFQKCKITVEN